jgi:N-acetylglucosaminyl-diphospho-decaprenol L-rhamnosyltransferase
MTQSSDPRVLEAGVAAAGAIAAVVVTYESEETIDGCLRRLRDADGVAQIRVVDNASSDDTLAIVQRHAAADARLHFIANPDNPGFAVACNQGAADCDAPWLAFVNPDCFVQDDSLERLLQHALALGGEALLGADLVDETGERDVAARRHDPDFQHMLRTASRSQLESPYDPNQLLQMVDAVSGALMVMSRALFERVGGFDDSYRLHAEDLDLCRRARDAGAVVAVANDVRVVHLRGVSSRSRPWFVEWHKHRGLMRYFDRYEAPRRGPLTRWAVRALIWLRFPFAVLRAHLRA